MSENLVILLGRLGKDPELVYSPSGMAICIFSMATSKKIKEEDVTQWHRLKAFDKRAEAIAKYVKRGDELYVKGELQYSQYDKDGITRYVTDIIVNQFSFVGNKRQNNQDDNQRESSPPANDNPYGDDVPF